MATYNWDKIRFNIWDADTSERIGTDLRLRDARQCLEEAGAGSIAITKLLGQEPGSIALQVGAFTVESVVNA